jgi:hypothetical protein
MNPLSFIGRYSKGFLETIYMGETIEYLPIKVIFKQMYKDFKQKQMKSGIVKDILEDG